MRGRRQRGAVEVRGMECASGREGTLNERRDRWVGRIVVVGEGRDEDGSAGELGGKLERV